jgi:hypothetical protein
MPCMIGNRSAEMLYQTGAREFRVRLSNGVEINVDVDLIDLVADVDLIEVGTDSDGTIVCNLVAIAA